MASGGRMRLGITLQVFMIATMVTSVFSQKRTLCYHASVSWIFAKIFSASSACFAAYSRDGGIHRRDAENFGFLSLMPINGMTSMSAPETSVGCKEGRVRRENPGSPLRLCGEFPFGCG